MLRIESLCKTLPGPRRLLAEVELVAAPGELVALVGESGCGKTTLLNLVAGLDRPDSGSIRLGDVDITRLDDDAAARFRRQAFGFVFQAFHLLPHLRIWQNVALPLWLTGVDAAAAHDGSLRALDRVGLAGRAGGWPRELSGGEMQRVAVARALIHRPRLVLADEPTGSLDPDHADRVLALLAEAVREAGAIGLLVTHSPTAAAFADRRLVFGRDGRLTPMA